MLPVNKIARYSIVETLVWGYTYYMNTKYWKYFKWGNGMTLDRLLHVTLIIIIIFFVVFIDAEQTKKQQEIEDKKIQELFAKNKIINEAIKEKIQSEKKFTGELESVDTSCFSDGVCSVVVSGKKIIETIGGRNRPTQELGTLIGFKSITDLKSYLGHTVEVYAEKTETGDYTLYGDKDYYIKLIK